ncbi:hypothetical protein C1H21_03220 [Xanthomonas arboricola pv. juglandis]|nr:hypothetical protein C1H21_03220 [Xanthomonas arboricola pv. juglandis]
MHVLDALPDGARTGEISACLIRLGKAVQRIAGRRKQQHIEREHTNRRICVGQGCSALTAPNGLLVALQSATHTDHLDWLLPAHRRGTLRGMDAA